MLTLLIKPDLVSCSFYIGKNNSHHAGDSGLDLYFPDDIVIPGKSTVLVDLRVACQLVQDRTMEKDNCVLPSTKSYWLLPRSSIYKTPLRMSNSMGLIDAGYTNTLKVPLDNTSDLDYSLTRGVKLFQIASGDLAPFGVEVVESLIDNGSTRGLGGFGSTDRL